LRSFQKLSLSAAYSVRGSSNANWDLDCYPIVMHTLFITGTDTGVGKTHAACVIARQLAASGQRVGAYKPVCSGAEQAADGHLIWDDVERLAAAINVPATSDEICPQQFLAPLAPPIAARLEQRAVDWNTLQAGLRVWSGRVDVLLIEGAGGLLCPLTETQTMAEFAVELGCPIVIVARPGLGTINHTLLTIHAARRQRLKIAGVVFCQTSPVSADPSVATNADEIESRSGVPVFGTIPHGNGREVLHGGKAVRINWRLLAES
jgi:dethiobiotin synthetase